MAHKKEGENLHPLSTYCVPGPVPCTLSSLSHPTSVSGEGLVTTGTERSQLGSEQERDSSSNTRAPGVSASKVCALAPPRHRCAEASSSLPTHPPPLTSVRAVPAGCVVRMHLAGHPKWDFNFTEVWGLKSEILYGQKYPKVLLGTWVPSIP